MREVHDEDGRTWEAIVLQQAVAHGKQGTVLAFRAKEEPDSEPLRTRVTFNSQEAGEFALRTMSDMELRRRVTLAKALAGVA